MAVIPGGPRGRTRVRIDYSAFRSLRNEISNEMVRTAASRTRDRAKARVKRLVGIDSGNLIRSVRYRVRSVTEARVMIGGPTTTQDGFDYSLAQEFGVPVIRAKTDRGMHLKSGRSRGRSKVPSRYTPFAHQTGGGGSVRLRVAGLGVVTVTRAAEAVPRGDFLGTAYRRLRAGDFTAGATRRS